MADLPKDWEVLTPAKPSVPAGWEIIGKYKTEADDLGDTAKLGAAAFTQGANEGMNPLKILAGLATVGHALSKAFPGFGAATDMAKPAIAAVNEASQATQPLDFMKNFPGVGEVLKFSEGIQPPGTIPPPRTVEEAYKQTGAEKTPLREGIIGALKTLGVGLPAIAAPGGLATTALSSLGGGIGRAVGGETGEAIGSVTGAVAQPMAAMATRGLIRGDRAATMQAAIDDARLAGTTPSVGQATGSTTLNRLESTVGRVGGPSVMRGFSEKQTAQMGERVEDIAGRFSPKMEEVTAGKRLLEGLTGPGGFVERSGKKAANLYSKVDAAVPENTPITMANTLSYMTERTKPNPAAPATSAEFNKEVIGRLGPKLEALLQDMQRNKGSLPYSAVKDIRTSVGKQIDDAVIAGDFTQREAKALYSSITADIEAALPPQALRAWQRANNFYRARSDHIENVITPIVNKTAPEKIISALETNAKQGSTMIRGVMSSLKPDDRSVVTAMFIRKMGEANPGAQTAAGTQFSIPQFLTRWNRLDDGAKRAMFDAAGGRDLRAALDSVANTAERIKKGSQVLANPSGTANASVSNIGFGATGIALLSGNLKIAGAIGGTLAAGNVTARMMTNPGFVRWLAQSTRIPESTAITSLDQLIMRTNDPALKSDLEAFRGTGPTAGPR